MKQNNELAALASMLQQDVSSSPDSYPIVWTQNIIGTRMTRIG
jgi:hypothetical protein